MVSGGHAMVSGGYAVVSGGHAVVSGGHAVVSGGHAGGSVVTLVAYSSGEPNHYALQVPIVLGGDGMMYCVMMV